jgi:hypothetical protein
MANLILKDEEILSSPSIVGYKVLELMKKRNIYRISVFDIADQFKNEKWFNPKNLYFAMLFLFSLDIIDFKDSYISKRK